MKIKLLAFLSSCTAVAVASSTFWTFSERISIAQPEPPQAYLEALEDAAKPEDDEVLDNLTAIVDPEYNPNLNWDDKGRVLVATFTWKERFEEGNFIKPSNDKPKVIWVTVVPELRDFCTNYNNTEVNNSKLNLRIEQLLGVRQNSGYTHIAEIWVNPEYLKRPTLDPEINDRTVQPLPNPIQDPLPFPEGVDEAYKDWFEDQIKQQQTHQNRLSNRERLTNNQTDDDPYPWTGLGYTYDWSPKTGLQTIDAGLSEFVIFLEANSELSSPLEVERVVSTEKYCKAEESP